MWVTVTWVSFTRAPHPHDEGQKYSCTALDLTWSHLERTGCPCRPCGGKYNYAGSAGEISGRNVAGHQEKHSPTAQHENNSLRIQNNRVSVHITFSLCSSLFEVVLNKKIKSFFTIYLTTTTIIAKIQILLIKYFIKIKVNKLHSAYENILQYAIVNAPAHTFSHFHLLRLI